MFQTVKFLTDHFRDAHNVARTLAAYGIDPPAPDTVRKWFERGSIPGVWLAALLVVLELKRGAPVRLYDYMEGRQA